MLLQEVPESRGQPRGDELQLDVHVHALARANDVQGSLDRYESLVELVHRDDQTLEAQRLEGRELLPGDGHRQAPVAVGVHRHLRPTLDGMSDDAAKSVEIEERLPSRQADPGMGTFLAGLVNEREYFLIAHQRFFFRPGVDGAVLAGRIAGVPEEDSEVHGDVLMIPTRGRSGRSEAAFGEDSDRSISAPSSPASREDGAALGLYSRSSRSPDRAATPAGPGLEWTPFVPSGWCVIRTGSSGVSGPAPGASRPSRTCLSRRDDCRTRGKHPPRQDRFPAREAPATRVNLCCKYEPTNLLTPEPTGGP